MSDFTGARYEVRLMTLDPGHFHAALVQKTMYDQVSPEVFVFAPAGPDLQLHMERINSYNKRIDNTTNWKHVVYDREDFFEQMINQKPGNLMVIAGNNAKKTQYILETVKNGINVLADKPMVIAPDKFNMLKDAFTEAKKNNVLLYDVMTERHEITTLLQKELSMKMEVFGTLEKGTPENPAITKESVHHFFKYVSGNPLIRPPWFFDTEQEGDGIVDVSTHLVDLVQWECFPEVVLDYKTDIKMLTAQRWPTTMDKSMFEKVTGEIEFPDYLIKDVIGDSLYVFANGAFTYTLKGVHAKISVTWNFIASEGLSDTHYSVMRGTNANLVIRQGSTEKFKPILYIESNEDEEISDSAISLAEKQLQKKYPGVLIVKISEQKWKVEIPEKYKIGHEAHFGQVTEKYLEYLVAGKLPDWEVPNMIAKYYTTTEALKMALQNKQP